MVGNNIPVSEVLELKLEAIIDNIRMEIEEDAPLDNIEKCLLVKHNLLNFPETIYIGNIPIMDVLDEALSGDMNAADYVVNTLMI